MTYSIVLLYSPPANTPLEPLDRAPRFSRPVTISPKSTASPVEAIVIYCILSLGAAAPPPCKPLPPFQVGGI